MRNTCRGQSTAEYAILIAIVIAGIVGMQGYGKRGLQARYKVASDRFTAGTAGQAVGGVAIQHTVDQYEPYYADQNVGTSQDRTQTEEFTANGTIVRNVGEGQDVTKRGAIGGAKGERNILTREDQQDDSNWQKLQGQ